MASRTSICNLALSHLAVSKAISNVDTERSAEALACRTFLDHCIEETSRDFVYPSLNKYRTLSLIESNPNTEWDYSYQYPSDCSRMLKILSGIRNDNRQTRVPYDIANSSTGKIIFTDEQNAVAKYVRTIDDVGDLDIDIVTAISFLLASYISPRVTGGDPFKLGEKSYNLYLVAKSKAEANAFNEIQPDEIAESEFIRAREYGVTSDDTYLDRTI